MAPLTAARVGAEKPSIAAVAKTQANEIPGVAPWARKKGPSNKRSGERPQYRPLRTCGLDNASVLGAAILVVAMALGAACSNSSAPIPSPSPPPVGTAGPAGLGGTWVLQQALQASDVDSASVETALSARGILGYSIRVPWSAVDGTSSILD